MIDSCLNPFFDPARVLLAEFSAYVSALTGELTALLEVKKTEPKGIAPAEDWFAYGARVQEAYGSTTTMKARERALCGEISRMGFSFKNGFDADFFGEGPVEIEVRGCQEAHRRAVREAYAEAHEYSGDYPSDEVLKEAAPRLYDEVIRRREATAYHQEGLKKAASLARIAAHLDEAAKLFRWTPVRFQVKRTGGGYTTASGHAVDGLVVAKIDDCWKVSHLETGSAIMKVTSKAQAQQVVVILRNLDWTRPLEVLTVDPAVITLMTLMSAFVRGEWNEDLEALAEGPEPVTAGEPARRMAKIYEVADGVDKGRWCAHLKTPVMRAPGFYYYDTEEEARSAVKNWGLEDVLE